MTDRSPTRADDNLVLGRQTAAEIDAARDRVRAYLDQRKNWPSLGEVVHGLDLGCAQLLATDVHTVLADLDRALANLAHLQSRLRGEKHHHANDVARLQELLGRVGADLNEGRAALEQEKRDSAWVLDRIRRNLGTPAGRAVSIHAREVRTERDALRALASPDKRGTATRPDEAPERLHTLTAGCWCEPASALDGHVNEDGSQPEFAATDHDPVDADGFLLEELAR